MNLRLSEHKNRRPHPKLTAILPLLGKRAGVRASVASSRKELESSPKPTHERR